MIRVFNCVICKKSQSYPNPTDAFMDGWKLDEHGHICSKCRKKGSEFEKSAEDYKLSTGLFGDRRR